MSRPIRCAVLTVSDRCSRGEAEDLSGPAVAAMARDRLRAEIVQTACVPDDAERIVAALRAWADRGRAIDLVLSTGGTGLSPRDVTPEAALRVIDRRHDGLMELSRQHCSVKTPRAYLSRGVAGTAGQTLIITLPGSPRGATETLEALLDLLPHAIEILRGEPGDHSRPET